jgi:glucose/arabinose dehydrogenase
MLTGKRLILWLYLGLGVLGFCAGAGGMSVLLLRKTGEQFLLAVDRILEAKTGRRVLPVSRSWKGGDQVRVKVEVLHRGLDNPVRIVFAPSRPKSPGEPDYYIGLLGGTIKVVTKDGQVRTFAEKLLNFEVKPMDELGVLGLAIDPQGRFFIATMSYHDEAAGAYRNKVERLGISADGLTMTDRKVLLAMRDEITVPSYQIQFASIHPKENLVYVGVGAGGNHRDAGDMGKFAGKILRMDAEGQPVPSNPFYEEVQGEAPRNYIYALGVRNPFDVAWDPETGVGVVSDVGPGIDRILRLEAGANYCYREDENEIRANSLFSWGPGGSFAPVGVAITHGDQFVKTPSLYVGLFGASHSPLENPGKRILRFDFDPAGTIERAPETLAVYGGRRFSTVIDVEAAPDGSLYFTDLWGESLEPHIHGGVVYRIVPDGTARPQP